MAMYIPNSRKQFDTTARLEASKGKAGLTHQDDLAAVLKANSVEGSLAKIATMTCPEDSEHMFRFTEDTFFQTENSMLNIMTPWQGFDAGKGFAKLNYYDFTISNTHTRKDGTRLPLPKDGNGIRVHWTFMERITSTVRDSYRTAAYTARRSFREYIIGSGEIFSPEKNEWVLAYLAWFVGRDGYPRIEKGVRSSSNRMYRVEPESTFVPWIHYIREILLNNHNAAKNENTGEIVQYYVKPGIRPYIDLGYRTAVAAMAGYTRDDWKRYYAETGTKPLLSFKDMGENEEIDEAE